MNQLFYLYTPKKNNWNKKKENPGTQMLCLGSLAFLLVCWSSNRLLYKEVSAKINNCWNVIYSSLFFFCQTLIDNVWKVDLKSAVDLFHQQKPFGMISVPVQQLFLWRIFIISNIFFRNAMYYFLFTKYLFCFSLHNRKKERKKIFVYFI